MTPASLVAAAGGAALAYTRLLGLDHSPFSQIRICGEDGYDVRTIQEILAKLGARPTCYLPAGMCFQMPITDEIARAFQAATRVRRSELYKTEHDRQIPNSLVESAQTPYVGFVGRQYRTGGTVLIALNPGGGGNTQKRTAGDAALERAIHALREAPPADVEGNLEEMANAYLKQLDRISIGKLISKVLEACQCTLAEVAFLNVFPYRTKKNGTPSAAALRRSVDTITLPLVKALGPTRIIFLGKKVSGIAHGRFDGPKAYTIQRTNGDRGICPPAARTLEQIRADVSVLGKRHDSDLHQWRRSPSGRRCPQ